MGNLFKIVAIVLAVLLLGVVVVDTRDCLGDVPPTSNLGNSAGALASCVRTRLAHQQEQLSQQISERFQGSPRPH